MAIIGTLPNNIQNGNTVDATPVMADFNFIVNQVNANANPIGTLTAPSGTRTIFHQAAAPVGWVIDATVNDFTIQLNSSTGGTSGGSLGYSTMFLNPWTSDGHSLTVAELAAHVHGVNDPTHVHGVNDPQHSHTVQYENVTGGGAPAGNGNTGPVFANTALSSTGITLANAATGISIQSQGSGALHSHTKTFSALYVAMILAQKT